MIPPRVECYLNRASYRKSGVQALADINFDTLLPLGLQGSPALPALSCINVDSFADWVNGAATRRSWEGVP
eukprot:4979498-Pyramimonas_sp.AAC.1